MLDLKSAKEIARDLGISQHAVEKHLKVVREKFRVDSTAEAARIFSLAQGGRVSPPYGSSDIAESISGSHPVAIPEQPQSWVRDSTGALLLDDPLTPRQTLLTIAAVCFVSIVGLLLLVACAEGVKGLVSG